MNWTDRLSSYKENRERVLSGNINCIPCPFDRFREVWPGIEQKKYYLITGDTNSAKTMFATYLFCIWPLWYAYNNPEKLKVKVHYVSLEMPKDELYDRIISHLLYFYSKGDIEISPTDLNSLNHSKILPEDILDKIGSKKLGAFLDFIDENLNIIETERNRYGIYKYCLDLSKAQGTLQYKEIDWKDWTTGEVVKKQVVDKYVPDDNSLYNILIVDHISLLSVSKDELNLYNTIGRWSSQDCVYLKNIYNWTICNIQQQSMESQNNEAFKLNRMEPSLANLSDNKGTSKDCNNAFGIFNPDKHNMKTYKGYDITKLKKNVRFISSLKSRGGVGEEVCPLYFKGAVNYFEELPKPTDININKYYND